MMGVRKFMEMVFTGRPFTAKEMQECDFVNAVVPFDELEAMTEKYALACARTRPTDTVFAQKVFFEIYKQHQGEYMGSIISGVLESTLRQLKTDPDAWELDREVLERGLSELGARQRRALPARVAPEPSRSCRRLTNTGSRRRGQPDVVQPTSATIIGRAGTAAGVPNHGRSRSTRASSSGSRSPTRGTGRAVRRARLVLRAGPGWRRGRSAARSRT